MMRKKSRGKPVCASVLTLLFILVFLSSLARAPIQQMMETAPQAENHTYVERTVLPSPANSPDSAKNNSSITNETAGKASSQAEKNADKETLKTVTLPSNPPKSYRPTPAPKAAREANAGPLSSLSDNKKLIVGYYTSWSRYNGYTPEKINASMLTHIHYAFADLGSDCKIKLPDSVNDLKSFAVLKDLKKANPGLKTLLSVGGWTYSKYFSDAASTSANREAFAQSCLDFVLTYGFDGVDLDWEYPVSGGLAGNINRPEDKLNFTYLLQAIRGKFNSQSAKDGKKYLISIAAGSGSSYLKKIEPAKVYPLVDYIFAMSYDLHGAWDAYSDFNAPLYTVTEPSPQGKFSVNDGITAYLNAGIPASKIVLGMPFYGYKYTVTSSANNGLFSPFTAASSVSYDSIVKNYLNNSAYKQFYSSDARVPYLFGNNTFISYENARSVTEKAGYAKNRGLAGVGIWELSYDTGSVLLNSACNAFLQLTPAGTSAITVNREAAAVTGIDLSRNTTENIKNNFENPDSILIVDALGNGLSENSPVGTGSKIQLTNEFIGIIDEATVIIYGDVDGNGAADGCDAALLSLIASGLLPANAVSSAVLFAADADGDGDFDCDDAGLPERAGLFLCQINQSGR